MRPLRQTNTKTKDDMPETREPTKEELAILHSQLRAAHEKAVGPLLTAFHDRLTESQRRAFFDPIYVPAAMNNFTYRRAFEPTGGVFANKGVLTFFFCIMDAATRTPCWVVRMNVGDQKVTNKKGKAHFEKAGKIRPAMLKVLDDLADSMLEGCGRASNRKLSEHKQTYYVYRAFTPHERKLAFPPFLTTPGVNIGPINVIEATDEKAE